MGANVSANNTNVGAQTENMTAARNASEADRRYGENAFRQWRAQRDDDHDEVTAAIGSTTTDRYASIAWDPITAVYELCTARGLDEPAFECGEDETSCESRRHVAQCSVTFYDSVVFRAVGAGDRRQVAKRIAAKAVYDSIAGRQVEDATENAAAAAAANGAGCSGTGGRFQIVNDHWSSRATMAADNSVSTKLETTRKSPKEVLLGRAGITVSRPYTRSRKNRNRAKKRGAAVEDKPRIHGPAIDIGGLLEEQKRLIEFDPVVKIRELCSRREWQNPEFECSVIAVPTTNSMSHKNTAKCVVRVDDTTYWAEGIARTKKGAIRLAAMRAYSELSGSEYQDVNPALR